MSNDEKPPQQISQKPRRNNYPHNNKPPQNPPGVDKALHFFGVPDLREFLNRKHEEQAYFESNKTNRGNAPPSEPSYNYLKDPLRDSSSNEAHPVPKPQHKGRQPFEPNKGKQQTQTIINQDSYSKQQNSRYINDKRNQQLSRYPPKQSSVTYDGSHRHQPITKDPKDVILSQEGYPPKQSYQEGSKQQENQRQNYDKRISQKQSFSNEQPLKRNPISENEAKLHPKKEGHPPHAFKDTIHSEGYPPKQSNQEGSKQQQNQKQNYDKRSSQKQSFSNEQPPKRNPIPENDSKLLSKKGGHQTHAFSNSIRGRGGHRKQKPDHSEAMINNPFNIKIELSTATGERNCVIDEATKVDIKHVPEKIPGTRGRGRGRGRGGSQRYRARGQKNVEDKDSSGHGETKQGNMEDVNDWDDNSLAVEKETKNPEGVTSKPSKTSEETEEHLENSEEFIETNEELQEFNEDSQEFYKEPQEFNEKPYLRECIGENYESELVKNLQENVVITTTNVIDNKEVTRSVAFLGGTKVEEESS